MNGERNIDGGAVGPTKENANEDMGNRTEETDGQTAVPAAEAAVSR
jgi:hypothetical protein